MNNVDNCSSFHRKAFHCISLSNSCRCSTCIHTHTFFLNFNIHHWSFKHFNILPWHCDERLLGVDVRVLSHSMLLAFITVLYFLLLYISGSLEFFGHKMALLVDLLASLLLRHLFVTRWTSCLWKIELVFILLTVCHLLPLLYFNFTLLPWCAMPQNGLWKDVVYFMSIQGGKSAVNAVVT